ncbi:MAG: HNH endonuclease [Candidatus Riflebacteria bacterium]|nr:HNH endonuclease [Candidatus Riflebacteria bacterium]
MRDNWVPESADSYSIFLEGLHSRREEYKANEKSKFTKRQSLSKDERNLILLKTDSRCHICGGSIKGNWEADHVLSHSKGGSHSIENYLPAHRICNNYRWDYLPEEFQEIMKLGILLRTEIENKTQLGKRVAEKFVKIELQRIKRRQKEEMVACINAKNEARQ